ncbi:putative O-methyltransferase [Saccharomonospora marina XMU15]|uniref:Putative O-methyltransferase n=1 Tax=Saccharomonospora marina XMU15 TaxID=882083 RepID=H5X7S3_9PSEU|nr:class I SAM-dependent methyltransferase [Saccharomonospora marina]EHR51366.1 putative O-methyltransferase [Saccharomonospora marina XMU15]
MPDRPGAERSTTAELFNGAVAASAICAAFELGLLTELEANGAIDPAGFAARAGLDHLALDAVILGLRHAGAVVEDGERGLVPGPAFGEIWRDKGYFLWLIGGYGSMLSGAAQVCRADGWPSRTNARDGGAIARAGKDYGAQFVDSMFHKLVSAVPHRTAADLGCGSARRLIELAGRAPEARFVGVEVDAAAWSAGREAVREAGLEDRIELVHSDLTALPDGAFPDVELVFSFFLAHDLLPRERFVKVLAALRRAFPGAQNLLLSDTYRSQQAADPHCPIFTLGFEYTHGLMRQQLPTFAQWVETFELSEEWKLLATHDLEIAYSTVFHLVPRDDARDALTPPQDETGDRSE